MISKGMELLMVDTILIECALRVAGELGAVSFKHPHPYIQFLLTEGLVTESKHEKELHSEVTCNLK